MSNEYYDHTTYPTPNSPGSSAALRAELDLIEAGFNKLPTLTGNGGKFIAVNAGGTALEASSALSFSGGALVVAPSSITWSGNPTHSGDHTWSGYHTLSAGTVNQVLFLNGSKRISGSGDLLYDGTYLTATFKSTTFALKDATVLTKGAAFDLSGITAGQTRSYALPDVSGSLATLGNISQTFTGTTLVSGTFNATGTFATLGSSNSATTVGVGTGTTASGQTKTVNIGTGGASGSTTNITLGSANAGSTTSVYIYSNGTLVAQAAGGVFTAASMALTGTPTAPTAAPGTSTTQVATTAFAMGMQSPAFTGTPTAPTASTGTATTQLATTAFVAAAAFNVALPGQSGNAGKFVTTDGTNASWAEVYPSQTGNSGKFLTTNGTATSWAEIPPANQLPLLAIGII
jgi:hypothetical protein